VFGNRRASAKTNSRSSLPARNRRAISARMQSEQEIIPIARRQHGGGCGLPSCRYRPPGACAGSLRPYSAKRGCNVEAGSVGLGLGLLDAGHQLRGRSTTLPSVIGASPSSCASRHTAGALGETLRCFRRGQVAPLPSRT
jgi:hypothetical protein